MGMDEERDEESGGHTPLGWKSGDPGGRALLRGLYESMHDAIMILEQDRIVDCNPRASAMFGCERGALLGRRPYDLSPPLQPDGTPSGEAARERLAAVQQGSPQLFEWRHVGCSGVELDTEVSLTPLGASTVGKLTLAIVRDVTARKRAEEKLRQTEAHESLVLRSLPMAFYTAHPDGDFGGIWVNERISRVTGFERSEFRSDRSLWSRRLHPEDRERVLGAFEGLSPGGSLEVEYRWKHAEGHHIWLLDLATLVPEHGEKRAMIIGSLLDITDRKRSRARLESLGRELRSLTQRLGEAEEAERRRIAVLLHDSAAQDLALALLKLGSLKQDLEPALSSRIEEISALVTSTAEEIRTLSHDLSPPELYDVGLEAALEALARRFQREVGVDCSFRDDGLEKHLDRDTMTTLFRCSEELLANVAKHAAARSVLVEMRLVGDRVEVAVEDDGRGFETETTGERRAPNGGFGLFSIHERLAEIGGSLNLRSVRGEGSRVVLSVPDGVRRESG